MLVSSKRLCLRSLPAQPPTSNPVQEPGVLPEVFADLNSVVESEAGRGRMVLLKKVAHLWASGGCALLNTCQLVVCLSLSSTRLDQGLASLICDQFLETGGCH
ncbi:hypothetical protein MC885_008216 [Smutsia gigantea]|nr:hypothetical protein MC885_008216 [Smutsia gigantea]